MSRENPIVYLRIPEDLKKRVKEEAAANGRSMTGEIVFRLRQAYGLTAKASERPA